MDGVLKQVKFDTWRGTLDGFQVEVAGMARKWLATVQIIFPDGSLSLPNVVLEARSLEHAGRRARAWIERNGRKERARMRS